MIDRLDQPDTSNLKQFLPVMPSFMEAFMDRLEVVSEPGKGTSVHMVRRLGNQEG